MSDVRMFLTSPVEQTVSSRISVAWSESLVNDLAISKIRGLSRLCLV